MRTRLPRAALAAAAIAAVATVVTGCTRLHHGEGTGFVTGLAPICYGPGPNMDLKPITVIRALRTDGLARTVKVHTANSHNTYRLALPAGRYKISTYSGAIHVVVRANATIHHADLPQPGCV